MRKELLALVRFLHVASGVYNIAYVYSPLRQWEYAFPIVQYGTIPLLVITGVALVRHRKMNSIA